MLHKHAARNIPKEAFVVGKNRYKDSLILLLKSAYSKYSNSLPSYYNKFPVEVVIIEEIL